MSTPLMSVVDQCPATGTIAGAPLTTGEVQVRWVRLFSAHPVVAAFESTLSADERARAKRWCFDADRVRFVTTRGLLRRLLAECLGTTPERVPIEYSPAGKPELRGAAADVRFSVSHSGDLAVLAFSCGADVGVDIECVRELDDMAGVARRVFSVAEQAQWFSLDADRRLEAFFRGWTKKEARVKGTGEGLSAALDAFDVSLDGRPVVLPADDRSAEGWKLWSFVPEAGYVAAVAVHLIDASVVVDEWKPAVHGTTAGASTLKRNR
jgi:4'-phosphopantetheinyl transferase